MKFFACNLHLQEGDIITSKKGILQNSFDGKRSYLCKKLKFIKNGFFESIGDKIEVEDVHEVKE
jgi:hypothetical protein